MFCNKYFIDSVLFLLAAIVATFVCFFSTLHADLKDELDDLFNSTDKNVKIGIVIQSLADDTILFAKNHSELFIPASTLKIFTAAAALSSLGVDYRFQTTLFLDSQGNLYIKGSGDPELSRYDLEYLAHQLKLLNIEQITGKIFVDNSEFDTSPIGPGWNLDDSLEPIDALNVDHNIVAIYINPNSEKNSAPAVLIDSPIASFPIHDPISQKKTVPDITIHSSTATQQPLLMKKIIISKPALYTGEILHVMLERQGIKTNGVVESGQVPKTALAIASHISRPLAQIVADMMKNSDNLYADCIFKKMGAVVLGAPGTWQKGSEVVREFLKREPGIDPSNMIILDGSGLSPYNRISPSQTTAVLNWVYHNFQVGPELLAAFPIVGIDGTVKNRLTQIRGAARAKTGGMPGISTLNGYIQSKAEKLPLIFTIYCNGIGLQKLDIYKKFEDQICLKLYHFTKDPS